MISTITGVDEDVITQKLTLQQVSVARKMSWAANRQSVFPEDVAYSLLGLFNVRLSISYGEGTYSAFRRLQEEILRRDKDASLFLWVSSGNEMFRGVFAGHPAEFSCFGQSNSALEPVDLDGSVTLTGQGVCFKGYVLARKQSLFLEISSASQMRTMPQRYGILLQAGPSGTYWRFLPQKLPVSFAPTTTSMAISTVTVAGDAIIANGKSLNRPHLPNGPHFSVNKEVSEVRPSLGLERSVKHKSITSQNAMAPPFPFDWVRVNMGYEGVLSTIQGSFSDDATSLSHSTHEDQEWEMCVPHSDADSISSAYDEDNRELPSATFRKDLGPEAEPSESPKKTRLTQFNGQNTPLSLALETFVKATLQEFMASEQALYRLMMKRGRMAQAKTVPIRRRDTRRQVHRLTMPANSELACPFYYKDPAKYHSCLTNHQLKRLHDVRVHLFEHHSIPFHCPTCKVAFNYAAERDEHIRHRRCTFTAVFPFVGVSQDQKKVISNINATGDTKRQWYQIWDVLFPRDGRPSSPYLRSGAGLRVALFRDFWRINGNGILNNSSVRLASSREDFKGVNIEELASTICGQVVEVLAKSSN